MSIALIIAAAIFFFPSALFCRWRKSINKSSPRGTVIVFHTYLFLTPFIRLAPKSASAVLPLPRGRFCICISLRRVV